MYIEHELKQNFITQHDIPITYPDYDNEAFFFNAIVRGDIEHLKEIMDLYFTQRRSFGENTGKLSKNHTTNRKYYFVILTTTIMRHCIAGGMDRETGFSLSVLYINKADSMSNLKAIDDLEVTMIEDFTKCMNENRKKNVISKQISKCIDYIYDNLHNKITVDSIAEHIGMNSSYLSKLFAKEMNITLSSYIKEQRLIAAAKLLEISEYSISEISENFVFSSQSHFTTDFQKKYGMTPKKYRDTHYVNQKPKNIS